MVKFSIKSSAPHIFWIQPTTIKYTDKSFIVSACKLQSTSFTSFNTDHNHMSMSSRIILPTIKPNAFLSICTQIYFLHNRTIWPLLPQHIDIRTTLQTIYRISTWSLLRVVQKQLTYKRHANMKCAHDWPTKRPHFIYVLYDSFRDKRPFKIDNYSPPCWIPDGNTSLRHIYILKYICGAVTSRKLRDRATMDREHRVKFGSVKTMRNTYCSCSASNSCCKRLIRHIYIQIHCARKRLACVCGNIALR